MQGSDFFNSDDSAKTSSGPLGNNEIKLINYNAYGQVSLAKPGATRLLYNGELILEGIYLLGAGYRAYGPTLMRFFSPDEHSPFGLGGINAFAYCSADPINFSDPDGRWKHNIRSARIPKPSLPPLNRTRNPLPQPTGSSRLSNRPNHVRPPHAADKFRESWRTRHPQRFDAAVRQRYNESNTRRPHSIDPLKNYRNNPMITQYEANTLHGWNKTNTRKFKYLNRTQSRLARYIVIESRLVGHNPKDNLMRAFPQMPNQNLDDIIYSVDRYMAEIRDPSKSTH